MKMYYMKKKENWQNRNVLVTGATGFVGPYLIRELFDRKARIKVLSMNKTGGLLEDKTTVVSGNITDQGSLKNIMKGIDNSFKRKL